MAAMWADKMVDTMVVQRVGLMVVSKAAQMVEYLVVSWVEPMV